MVWIASARRTAGLALFIAGIASAQAPSQATLPPTSPTTLPAPNSPTSTHTPAPSPSRPPQIQFAANQLQVVAEGTSLNQILRDISKLTSISITGGVSDEPVYGTYGPGAPGDVLSALLDGTGCNMLLRESTPSKPGELILTPRTGGPTPPNPNAALDDDAPATLQPRPTYLRPNPPPPPQPTTSVDAASQSTPPTPANSSTAPGGPQTPEQIYQQLQRIQQAQPHP
jgi:hypothetical protein